MAILRHSVIESIYTYLDGTIYGASAFVAEFPEKGDVLFKIVFSADHKYSISYAEKNSNGYVSMSPGRHKNTEVIACKSIDEAQQYINDWAVGIRQELMAISRIRNSVDDVAEVIDAFIKDKLEEPDGRFSSSEIEELRERLLSLERRFEELLEKSEISKHEYSDVKKSIDIASSEVAIFTKRVWYKTAMTKVLSTVKAIANSKEGRDLIASAAKKMLGLD
ncbi:hypothetical protein [Pseudomonas anguilliseptica]|uniref:hypothetical protein n=1 Tax=Pseudomonas anguilliseptica TaxID=53406 RepID=UPI00373625E5